MDLDLLNCVWSWNEIQKRGGNDCDSTGVRVLLSTVGIELEEKVEFKLT